MLGVRRLASDCGTAWPANDCKLVKRPIWVKVALVAVCRLDMLRIKAGSQRRACQEEPAPT